MAYGISGSASVPDLVRVVRLLIRQRGAYIRAFRGEAPPGTGGWHHWRGRAWLKR